ncbi:hypothetical protein AAT17_11905 [Nonlabens sp. MIC269]|uniref:hypothetical protein n=1 Tax=Nonlabens sp. MIC269 TaxID=1476901 RepID=UPI0007216479|nr:hypothetical protein [Nonlabens sp. MIC269]ALM21889.1 hypothetical protein AAT17_11905 [Nonlabens sp. MIC269]
MNKLFFLPIYFEFQSTLKTIRETLISSLFRISSQIYIAIKPASPWDISVKELLQYHYTTLGFHLGCFLLKHDFTPQPKCEDHDIFHLITGYDIDTSNEIAMQFWLYGNGKRSYYIPIALLAGILFYPDSYSLFKTALKNGRESLPVYHKNYRDLLHIPISQLKPVKTTYKL